jgi:quinol-cytochrome oxidoreductase complex cytochrome b subunit
MNLPSFDFKKIKENVINSQVWRSMFRGGTWKNTSRDRAQHILGNVWLHLHPARVRPRSTKFTYTFGLGGISFLLFLILTVTGVLLMFYYRPAVNLAYRDMKDLEFVVTLGKLMRNMHRWSAHAMVVVVILHMIRVFLTGGYKTPREFNWGIGVVLLVLTLFLSFTGYLLPWDQLAIWAVTVGTNMASSTPFVGAEGPFSSLLGVGIKNDARFGLLGGTMVGENTLLRFYVLHCVAVPVLTGILIIVHFWRIRKDGFSAAPLPGDPPEKKIEVWPNLIVREYVAAILVLVGLFVWSILQNAPLEELANRSSWYTLIRGSLVWWSRASSSWAWPPFLSSIQNPSSVWVTTP